MALNVLGQVASVSGKNEKLQILKDNSDNKELADLLNATFDRNRIFHIKKWDMPKASENLGSQHDAFMQLLKCLEDRYFTGNEAKAQVEGFFSYCDEEQQEWYAKVLRKDLKAGFSDKTAVKAGFKDIPLFDVMLAKDGKTCKKLDEIIEKGVYISPKYDGYRCLAIVDNGTVTLLSRNGTEYYNFPTVAEALGYNFPEGQYVFDGEIMSDDFQAMQRSAFANKRGTTVGDVKFHIFGYIPFDEWKAQKFKMKTSDRLKELYRLDEEEKFAGDALQVVTHVFTRSLDEILRLEKEYLEQGYEGAMALPDIPYYLGKKSNRLLKFKTMESQDCEVIGFYEGKKGTRLEGTFGGFIVKQEDGQECRVGTGFSDEDRNHLMLTFDTWYNTIIEVKYQELTNDGIMRFPVFMRKRPDKNAS